MVTKLRLAVLLLLSFAAPALAQEARSEHTFTLAGADPGTASIQDFEWLVGFWRGEAFGATVEEMWSPPAAGTMVGTFKLYGDTVSLYELVILTEVGDSVTMRLKHFRADFVGWEEKDVSVDFPLVRLASDAAHFDGLTFVRTSPDRLDVYLMVDAGEGAAEEHLVYRRAPMATETVTDARR